MSNRSSDTRGEHALGLFLDHYFYPRFCERENCKGSHRVFDVSEQKLGADVLIVDSSGKSAIIDEKAQLHYINEPRDTFAFEISYYNENTNSIADGWFVSNQNKTEYYVLTWIDSARTNQLNRIVEDDFSEITVALVSKKRIINYLVQLGYPIKRIRKIARDLRLHYYNNYYKLSDKAFLYYTREGYDEKPINIVIKREILSRLSYGVYRVNRERLVKIVSETEK